MGTILTRYGAMPYLEELTFTGIARRMTGANIMSSYPKLGVDVFPRLKKLHIQPTEMRDGGGNVISDTDANYNAFTFGHYIFSGTNLTELTLGKLNGPFHKGGGYYRNKNELDESTNSVGSTDGLTLKIYTDEYRAVGGFMSSLAANTTLIEYDYLTGEVLTP